MRIQRHARNVVRVEASEGIGRLAVEKFSLEIELEGEKETGSLTKKHRKKRKRIEIPEEAISFRFYNASTWNNMRQAKLPDAAASESYYSRDKPPKNVAFVRDSVASHELKTSSF